MLWLSRGAAFIAIIVAFAGRAELALARGNQSSEAEAKMFAEGADYERYMGRWSRLLAREMYGFAGVKGSDRVLDVGSGSGALASTIAAALPKARVVGIDPSASFVAYARAHATSERTRYEIGDAQALQFEDGSFDATLALLVMNFVPDHEKAIAEMRRVTKPQGVVSACVWDYDAGMQSLRVFWDEAVALDAGIEPKDERHMKLSRRGQLAELWGEAGLVGVQEKPLSIEQSFSSFDDYWGPFTKGVGPAGAYVAALPEEQRTQLAARLHKRVLGNRKDGPFVLKARAWCVRGRVPSVHR